MKKLTAFLLVMIMLAVSLPVYTYATECAGHEKHESSHVWEKEVIVEVACEEDTFDYPMNPNYRYTFVWETPAKTRAVCDNCARSTMTTINRKSQYACDDKMCPYTAAGAYNDLFNTWHTRSYNKCSACGYESEGYDLRVTYTSRCSNDNNPSENGEWEVRAEYTQANGYNLHQSLYWWLYYSMA